MRYIDATKLSLGEWIALMWEPPDDAAFIHAMFPSVIHREEFLKGINRADELDVHMLLQHFLVESVTYERDHISDYDVHRICNNPTFTGVERRQIQLRLLGWEDPPVWEGIHWIIDLAASRPRDALDVLDAWIHTHLRLLSDHRIWGLSDAKAIIRAYYILRPAGSELAEAALDSLSWRDFEYLCGVLYEGMKYVVNVTPRSADGGIDVVAKRTTPGMQEHCIIQAKKWNVTRALEAADVRELVGAMHLSKATRAVLVTTALIRKGAHDTAALAGRIQVIDRNELLTLLAEHCGADWWIQIDYRIAALREENNINENGD